MAASITCSQSSSIGAARLSLNFWSVRRGLYDHLACDAGQGRGVYVLGMPIFLHVYSVGLPILVWKAD